jgi:putative NADH-flavin reductase
MLSSSSGSAIKRITAGVKARWAGHSTISVQDHAVALIDELENPTHIRKRFTVGY